MKSYGSGMAQIALSLIIAASLLSNTVCCAAPAAAGPDSESNVEAAEGTAIDMAAVAELRKSAADSLDAEKNKVLTIQQAIDLALKNSRQLDSSEMDITEKNLQYTQAKHAVRDYYKKQYELRVTYGNEPESLNAALKPGSLADDMEFSMKLPEADKALRGAREAYVNAENTLKYDVERQYTDTYASMLALKEALRSFDSQIKSYDEAALKLKFRLIKQGAFDETGKKLEQAQSETRVALLKYMENKDELGDKLGMDAATGYIFENQAIYVPLDPEFVWVLAGKALDKDFEVYGASEARKLAQAKVNAARNLYVKKFGYGYMSALEAFYSSEKLDRKSLMADYEALLLKVKQDWEGWIAYRLADTYVALPKYVLQGEYDGLRYLGDDRYMLPILLMELDKSRMQEQEARENLIKKVRQSFNSLMIEEEHYLTALKALDKAEADYENARSRYKLKMIGSNALEESSQRLDKAESDKERQLCAYKNAIYKLNSDSGRVLEAYIKTGEPPLKSGIDKLKPPTKKNPEQEKPSLGKWELREKAGSVTSELLLNVDGSLGFTHYELYSWDGKQIGSKTELAKGIVHLTFVLEDTASLTIKFYKDGKEAATGELDGYGTSGSISISPAEGD